MFSKVSAYVAAVWPTWCSVVALATVAFSVALSAFGDYEKATYMMAIAILIRQK